MKILLAICCILALQSSLGVCDITDDFSEEAEYATHKSELIQQGETEAFATCIIDFLRAEGAAKGLEADGYTAEHPKVVTVSQEIQGNCRMVELYSSTPIKVLGISIVVIVCTLIIVLARYGRREKRIILVAPYEKLEA